MSVVLTSPHARPKPPRSEPRYALEPMVGIIIAHGGAAETVTRHFPNWYAAFERVIFISPGDDPLDFGLHCGASCKSGAGSVERMQLAVTLASRFAVATVLEYDTLLFGEWQTRIPFGNEIQCSWVFDNPDPGFTAKQFGHSPWCATGDTWFRVLQEGQDWQGGWPDRWLALAAQKAEVKLTQLPNSFSCDWQWTPEIIAKALEARRNGALAIHGFKSREVFDLLCLTPSFA